jgi:hypothetical protein
MNVAPVLAGTEDQATFVAVADAEVLERNLARTAKLAADPTQRTIMT